MTGSAGQLEDGTLPRALPLTPGQSGPLRQMLCSPVQVRGPWLQAAGLCEQGTERPPKVNSLWWEKKRLQRTGPLSPSPRKGNRIHLPSGGWLLGVKYRLSSRKWANGVRETWQVGSRDQKVNKEQIHELRLFALELPKTR